MTEGQNNVPNFDVEFMVVQDDDDSHLIAVCVRLHQSTANFLSWNE